MNVCCVQYDFCHTLPCPQRLKCQHYSLNCVIHKEFDVVFRLQAELHGAELHGYAFLAVAKSNHCTIFCVHQLWNRFVHSLQTKECINSSTS